MIRIAVSRLRQNFAEAFNRVVFGGERVILHRHGRDLAVLISMEELARLESGEAPPIAVEAVEAGAAAPATPTTREAERKEPSRKKPARKPARKRRAASEEGSSLADLRQDLYFE